LEHLGLITMRKAKPAEGGQIGGESVDKVGLTPGVAADKASTVGLTPGVDTEAPPTKKPKLDEVETVQPASFVQMETTQLDGESLEMDLERLLDAAIDSDPVAVEPAAGGTAADTAPGTFAGTAARPAPESNSFQDDSQDIEAELQKMLDAPEDSQTQTQPTQPVAATSAPPTMAAAAPAAAPPDAEMTMGSPAAAGAGVSPRASQLTQDLENLMDEVDFSAMPSQRADDYSQSQSLEKDLEKIMDEMDPSQL